MSQAALNKSAKTLARSLRSSTGAYLKGKVGIEGWYEGAYGAIYAGHLDAWVAGRRMGGALGSQEELDEIEARRLADFQSQYLDGFRDDLEAGRYDGNPDAALSRGDLYALSLRGTASESWVATCDEDDPIKARERRFAR